MTYELLIKNMSLGAAIRNILVVYHHWCMYSRLPKLFVASPLGTQP